MSLPLPPHADSLAAPPTEEDGLAIGAGFDFTDPSSPLAPYYCRTGHVVAALLLALVFLLLNHARLWHTDIWGHLKFGQWIVEHGALPARDPSCVFTEEEPVALHYSWLSQAALDVVYHAGEALAGGDAMHRLEGGVDLLRVAHALLVTLRCLLLLLAFRRLSGSLPRACAALAAYLVLSLGGLAVLRPQVLGELCFAALLLALSRPVLSRRAMCLLPPLFVLWANAHASFVVGFLFLGAMSAGKGNEWLRARRSTTTGDEASVPLRRLLLATACCGVAVAVLNPAGPQIIWNTLRMARHPNVLVMDEWQPLRIHAGLGAHWAYLAALVLVLAAGLRRPGRIDMPAIAIVLIFGLQPLWHQRALVWWRTLAPWLAVRARAATRQAPAADEGQHGLPSFRKTLLAGACVLLALAWSIPGQWLAAGTPAPLQRSLSAPTPWRAAAVLSDPAHADLFPELSRQLQAHYAGGRFSGRIFASETLGDYFVWRLSPRVQVFIYTHVHLFSPEHWHLVATVRGGAAGWRDVLDRNGINLVVVEADLHPRLCALLRADRNWRVVSTGASESGRPLPGRLFVALRTPPVPVLASRGTPGA
jgi:hypothetical protein